MDQCCKKTNADVMTSDINLQKIPETMTCELELQMAIQ